MPRKKTYVPIRLIHLPIPLPSMGLSLNLLKDSDALIFSFSRHSLNSSSWKNKIVWELKKIFRILKQAFHKSQDQGTYQGWFSGKFSLSLQTNVSSLSDLSNHCSLFSLLKTSKHVNDDRGLTIFLGTHTNGLHSATTWNRVYMFRTYRSNLRGFIYMYMNLL